MTSGDSPPTPGQPTPGRSGGTQLQERTQLTRPRLYRVLLLNDDYTPMDFVVEVLTRHFRRSPAEARAIMLAVHYQGSGVAGVYTREVAESKVARVEAQARQEGFPLTLDLQEDR